LREAFLPEEAGSKGINRRERKSVNGGGNVDENRRCENPIGLRVKKHNTGSRSYR
jgi:hypothetical protein